MLLDLVNRISSEYSQKSSMGRPESTSQGRPLNVRLRRPLDVISGRPQDVRLGRPRDGQIGSLGDVLGTLEWDVLRTSWGPIFAGWIETFNDDYINIVETNIFAMKTLQLH